MDVSVTMKGIDDSSALRSQAEERLRSALDRFQSRVRNVSILLEDVTGPHKQTVDKRCRISVWLAHGGELTIDEVGADAFASLAVALDRLKASISREIGRKKRGVGAG